ncbi:hypothetical protein B0H19DRAFT_335187 [Mycena capillaripes]|nr:hypothetical protein B0H19DRAFT_335187 [Mycena capillaripes]
MRFVAILASLSLVSTVYGTQYSRQVPGFPDCAQNCINDPTNLGDCQATNLECLCKRVPFIQTTYACMLAACQGPDQQSAINGAESLCLDFGVTLTAESSAIVAGLSTIASGASVTGSGSQVTNTASSTAPPAATGAARRLTSGHFLGTTVAVCAAAALAL